jgi:hypothetical protein
MVLESRRRFKEKERFFDLELAILRKIGRCWTGSGVVKKKYGAVELAMAV